MNDDYELDAAAPWLVIFITVLGGFLRALQVEIEGMWLDEAVSVWLANQSAADLLRWVTQIDQHPPLSYLLLHAWVRLFGDSPYDVRFLSVLFGTATIPVIYFIGKRMVGSMAGVAAAVFLAVSPFHVYFSQETRMYTLLAFNAGVAIYALVRLLTDPGAARPIGSQVREFWRARRASLQPEPEPPPRPDETQAASPLVSMRAWFAHRAQRTGPTLETDLSWLAFVVFSALTLYSHNTAILFPLAVNVFVLGLMLYQKLRKAGSPPAFQAPSLGNWIVAHLAILLLWSPWIGSFFRQAQAVDQRFWIPAPTWEAVVQLPKTLLNASAPLSAGLSTLIWSLYGLILLLGLVYLRKRLSRFLFLAALFFIPVGAELLVSLRRPIFWDRTLIWIMIPLLVLLGAGIAQLRFRFLVITLVGIMGFINLFSVGDYFRWYQKEDWSTPAGYVAKFAEQDDLVLFNSNFVVIPFDYYFQQYEDLYSLRIDRQGVPKDLYEDRILEPEMTAADVPALMDTIAGHERVWLVYSHDSYTDPQGLIPQALASRMKLTRTRDFIGGQVQLYESP